MVRFRGSSRVVTGLTNQAWPCIRAREGSTACDGSQTTKAFCCPRISAPACLPRRNHVLPTRRPGERDPEYRATLCTPLTTRRTQALRSNALSAQCPSVAARCTRTAPNTTAETQDNA